MKQLEWLAKTYYTIMKIDDQEKRDKKLERLMDQMEKLYQIPEKPSSLWIQQNKAIIALYYRISLSIWSVSHKGLFTY